MTTARPPQPGHASELVRAIIKRGSTIDPADEASVLRSVTRSASAELASCLRAIDAYEALCRPLLDTFDLLRALSTKIGGGPIDPAALAKHRLAAKLVAWLADGVRRIQDDANLGTWASSTLTLASTFDHVKSVPDLYQAVIAHHERAQNDKPPDGKRSWFERGRGDQVSIRQTPFFDDNDGPRRVTTALAEIMAQREDRRISFTAPGRQLPDKSYELMVPEALRVPFLRRMKHRFAYVDEHEVDEHGQPTEDVRRLHAKSLWLEREDAAIYCIGSSNFTCAGTGLANGAGNYELNLAYVLPDLDAEFVQICKQTYPPDHRLDLDTDTPITI